MPKGFDNTIAAALQAAARAERAESARHLSALGLHPGQDVVLATLADARLARRTAMTVGELAHQLGVTAPTVSKALTRLARGGLVTRRGEGRTVRVVLTKEGDERADALAELRGDVEAVLCEGLKRKDRKRARKLLRRMARNVADHASAGAPVPDDSPDLADAALGGVAGAIGDEGAWTEDADEADGDEADAPDGLRDPRPAQSIEGAAHGPTATAATRAARRSALTPAAVRRRPARSAPAAARRPAAQTGRVASPVAPASAAEKRPSEANSAPAPRPKPAFGSKAGGGREGRGRRSPAGASALSKPPGAPTPETPADPPPESPAKRGGPAGKASAPPRARPKSPADPA